MDYLFVILIAFFGFVALAVLLLLPVYRFLKREERLSERWTEEELERQRRKAAAGNGEATVRDLPEEPDVR